MALQFVAASGQILEFTDAGLPSTGAPSTLAAWCYEDGPVVANRGVYRMDSLASGDCNVLLSDSGVVKLGVVDQGVASTTAGPGLAPGLAVYFFAGATFSSSTSRAGYMNTSSGSSATGVTPTAINRLQISCSWTGVPWNGRLASLALWTAALTAAEMASLARGFPPKRVRPQSLYTYVPGVRNLFDYRQGKTFTVTGGAPTVAVHPRQYAF